jgi:chromosome segregation ATPase
VLFRSKQVTSAQVVDTYAKSAFTAADTITTLLEQIRLIRADQELYREQLESAFQRIFDLETEREATNARVSQLESEKAALQRRIMHLEQENKDLRRASRTKNRGLATE